MEGIPKFEDDKKEEGGLTSEQKQQFVKEMDKFWKDTFEDWNNSIDTSKIKFTPQWTPQGKINFKELAEATDKNKFGEYIANPETAFLDYESLGNPKIFSPDADYDYQNWLKEEGRENTVCSFMEYVHQTFGDTHYLPGVEYQRYLSENQDKIPEDLTHGYWTYSPGCVFGSGDKFNVIYGKWNGVEWCLDSDDLRSSSDGRERVVLFEKPKKLDEKGVE